MTLDEVPPVPIDPLRDDILDWHVGETDEILTECKACGQVMDCDAHRLQLEVIDPLRVEIARLRSELGRYAHQVTTVEELEALNRDALVTSATQSGVIPVPVWRIFAGLGWDGEPLTVVWQP